MKRSRRWNVIINPGRRIVGGVYAPDKRAFHVALLAFGWMVDRWERLHCEPAEATR